MNTRHRFFLYAFCLILPCMTASLAAQDLMYYTPAEDEAAAQDVAKTAHIAKEDAIMVSTSSIDWSKQNFSSNVSLDIVKAGIPMPSGKTAAVNRIQQELPILIKDPLLSLYVDDNQTLGELVLDGTVTLDEITRIIDSSKQTPAYFENGGDRLLTQHTIKLQEISSLLVKHHTPYTLQKPIQRISSRPYSGIVIDARGTLPVKNEPNRSSAVKPCLFPKIWDEKMTLVYERNMVNPDVAKKESIVSYVADRTNKTYAERVGSDPLWITAKSVFGVFRCDPVISHEDYLRIATVPENLKLLQEGRVIILLNKDELAHAVAAPEKDFTYWRTIREIQKYTFIDKVQPATPAADGPGGITWTVEDLRFIADSAQLLPEERDRIDYVADEIKRSLASGLRDGKTYTVMVEGHTADVNKPQGQLTLSIQRAETIVNELVARGIDRELFTYRGYGGTKPIADNSTPEGRAKNRRVEIIVMPESSVEQRR